MGGGCFGGEEGLLNVSHFMGDFSADESNILERQKDEVVRYKGMESRGTEECIMATKFQGLAFSMTQVRSRHLADAKLDVHHPAAFSALQFRQPRDLFFLFFNPSQTGTHLTVNPNEAEAPVILVGSHPYIFLHISQLAVSCPASKPPD